MNNIGIDNIIYNTIIDFQRHTAIVLKINKSRLHIINNIISNKVSVPIYENSRQENFIS